MFGTATPDPAVEAGWSLTLVSRDEHDPRTGPIRFGKLNLNSTILNNIEDEDGAPERPVRCGKRN
jgi:hypothetical protein